MFNKCIRGNQLTSAAANNVFDRIKGGDWDDDVSFLSTLRALIYPRIQDRPEEHVDLRFSSSRYSAETMRGAGAAEYFNASLRDDYMDRSHYLHIHSFARDGAENIEFFRREFPQRMTGWVELENVRALFRQTFDCLCYVNTELRSTIVFIDALDYKKLHYLQCATLGLLPWYFDKDAGCTDLELELIYSLREKTAEKYEETINRFADLYNIRELNIRLLLNGFESASDRAEIERLSDNVQNQIERIHYLDNEIADLLKSISRNNTTLIALKNKVAAAENEGSNQIMSYFLSNNRLHLLDVTGNTVRFNVTDYLEYYDEDVARATIENKNSYVYNTAPRVSSIRPDEMGMLMRAVFLDQILKIRVCAQYTLECPGGVNGISYVQWNGEYADYMPNPHIDRYSCMGNYTRIINGYLMDADYLGAIDQCIASAKSLNWGDGCVMNQFMETMYGESNYNNKCIELPTGEVVTPVKAIAWLHINREKNENAEE